MTDPTSKSRKAAATKYKKKFAAIFTNAATENKQAADLIIQRAAFLAATMDELQEYMQSEGVIGVYDNGGGQTGINVSAYLKSYTMANQQFLASMKQLVNFLPAGDTDAAAALKKFLKK